MRILQLIDSLEIGGAEKMAVNYANSLSETSTFSGLVATRKEGKLQSQLLDAVSYLFLNKRIVFDLRAIFKLRNYIKSNQVTHIQAHSSSFFTAVLVKFFYFKVKIIWHDHNGLSEFLSTRNAIALKLASLFFEGIIVVNEQLYSWAKQKLYCKKIRFLPNFTVLQKNQIPITKLKGEDSKRIICVANLRFQKNHLFLLEVAVLVLKYYPDWSFHLLGKDFKDNYSSSVNENIKKYNLDQNVFLYGSVTDVQSCIKQTEIAIITSKSEGLPVVLLEYGLLEKAVISTSVGEIPSIITHQQNGLLVEKTDVITFAENIKELIEYPEQRKYLASNLKNTVTTRHDKEIVIAQFLDWILK